MMFHTQRARQQEAQRRAVRASAREALRHVPQPPAQPTRGDGLIERALYQTVVMRLRGMGAALTHSGPRDALTYDLLVMFPRPVEYRDQKILSASIIASARAAGVASGFDTYLVGRVLAERNISGVLVPHIEPVTRDEFDAALAAAADAGWPTPHQTSNGGERRGVTA